jgi:hypothetical protein
MVRLGCFAFEKAIECLAPQSEKFMPVLNIALQCSDRLKTKLPTWRSLLQDLGYTPPDLLCVVREQRKRLWHTQKYVAPVPSVLPLGSEREGIYVYYQASRDEMDIANGWEFGRWICAEYYPASLRGTETP